MQPAEANELGRFLTGVVEREHATTRKVIAAIPEGKEDYRPDPRAMSAVDLAWHLAGSELMFATMVVEGALPTSDRSRPENVKTAADVVRFYDEKVAPAKAQLKSATLEQFAKVIDFRGVLTAPAAVFLNILVSHSSHHRGQLSVYLRPMGAKVPSIYGQSGDEEVSAS